MSEISKVFVLDPDVRAGRQIQLGFSREGVPCAVVSAEDPTALPAFDHPGLILVGGTIDLVRAARGRLGDADVPIVFAGRGPREAARAAGADEIVALPAYVRDVVTIARLLRGIPQRARDHLVGSLAETTGVYTLIRALAALGRSGVLTLIRGLRRGEVRFFHGEVTSAQVGLIHGQAALHQVLLWTDARFEFQHEDVVRRQQIPLPARELFADAERFLEGVRDSAGALSPAMVLEQDQPRVQGLGKQIPTEVHGVLRMFDGHRVLADVLEDSPYRVFETLRVAQKAVEAGLLRVVPRERPKATWKAVLAIEEWLVGSETRDAVVARTAELDSGPVSRPRPKGGSRKRRKKRRAATPPVGVKAEIDWGALVPRTIGEDVGPVSGVVPTMQTAGEIAERPSREEPREGLEALMNTAARDRIFPRELEEPSVVLDEQPPAPSPEPSPEPPAALESADEALARVRESVTRMRLEREAREQAAAKAAEEARRAAAAEEERGYAARALAAAEARRAEAEKEDGESGAVAAAAAAAVTGMPTPAGAAASTAASASESASESASASVSASTSASVPEVAPEAAASPPGDPIPVTAAATATATAPSPPSSPPPTPTPIPIDDSPSDGVIRAPIATADTAKLGRSRRPSPAPVSDGPPVPELNGEIPDRAAPTPPPPDPAVSGPSILVADLATAHAAAMAVAARPAEPPPADAASPSRELAVQEVRRDAVAFTEAEEAFFKTADPTAPVPATRVESFDDLDEGYERPKFWDRVFGRRRRRPSTASPPIRKPPTEK